MTRALVALCVLLSLGCRVRCRAERVPIHWADGTTTRWTLAVCAADRPPG